MSITFCKYCGVILILIHNIHNIYKIATHMFRLYLRKHIVTIVV